MILPSKHLSSERAILTIGAYILMSLKGPHTVSALWEELKEIGEEGGRFSDNFYTFILALDFLFTVDAIDYEEGLIFRRKK